MPDSQYNIALKVTADTVAAEAAISSLQRKVAEKLASSSSRGADSIAALFQTSAPSISDGRISLAGVETAQKSYLSSGNSMLGSVFTKGNALASGIGTAFSKLLPVAGQIVGVLWDGISKVGSLIAGAFNFVFETAEKIIHGFMAIPELLLKGFLTVGAAVAAVMGAAYLTNKALAPAAEMERYRGQLSIQGKSDLLPYYDELSRKTPYSLSETVQGGILLENFGIASKEFLGDIMDAGTAFKKDLGEVVRSVAYIKSGRMGEAFESLSTIGITRENIAARGIRFDANGTAQNKPDEVFAAVIAEIRSRFGGTAERTSGTYEGAISNLKDEISRAFAQAFQNILPYATNFVQNINAIISDIGTKLGSVNWTSFGESITNLVDSAKSFFSGIDWAGWAQTLIDAGTKLANLTDKIFSERGRAELGAGLLSIWTVIKEQSMLVAQAMLVDLKTVFMWAGEWIFTQIRLSVLSMDSIVKNILALAIEQAFKSVMDLWRVELVSLIGYVLGVLREFIVGLGKMLSYIPGVKFDKDSEMARLMNMNVLERLAESFKVANDAIPKLPASTLESLISASLQSAELDQKRLQNQSNSLNSATAGALQKAAPALAEAVNKLLTPSVSTAGAEQTAAIASRKAEEQAREDAKRAENARAAAAAQAAKDAAEQKQLQMELIKYSSMAVNELKKMYSATAGMSEIAESMI